MAQEYKLVDLEKSDFQDHHGNFWVTAAFEGVSEPVKWVVKDPTAVKVGENYYGEVKEQASKAGKLYLRFFREKRPDEQRSYQHRDDEAIRAQWAIGQAVIMSQTYDLNTIEQNAKALYDMVDRVKRPKAEAVKVKQQPQTGYDRAKQVAGTLKAKTTDEVVNDFNPDDPINLDNIPF